jgi:hypothetical protein
VTYEETTAALVARIVALGPQVLDVTDAFRLFQLPGFACGDLEPSLAQADFALARAKEILRRRTL